MALSPLAVRTPGPVWIAGALCAALFVHAAFWLVALGLTGAAPEQAAGEVGRQVVLALFWMACAMIMWRISAPPSRLHATMNVLTCAVFVTVAGTLAGYARLTLIDQIVLDWAFIVSTALLGFAGLVLAIPSAFVLQLMLLGRKR